MKKTIKFLWFIAIVAVIGFSMAACVEPEPDTTAFATGNLKIEILYRDGMRGTALTAVYDGPEKIKSYEWECGWRGDDGWGEYQTRTGKGKDFKVSEGEEKREFKVTVTFEGDYYPEDSKFSFYNRETNKYTDIIDQVLPTGTLDGTWYKTCLVNDIKPTGLKVDVDALLIINGLDFIYYIFKPDFAAGTVTDVSKIIELHSEYIDCVWKGDKIDLSYYLEGNNLTKVPDKYNITLFFSHSMDHYDIADDRGWGERIEEYRGNNPYLLELAKDGKSFTLSEQSWGGGSNIQLIGTWEKGLPPAPDPDDGSDVPEIFTSVAEVVAYLADLPENDPSTPVLLTVAFDLGTMTETTSDWQQLVRAIGTADIFVDLDLSACTIGGSPGTPGTGTTFNPVSSAQTLSSGKDKIMSIILPDIAESIQAGTSTSDQPFKGFTTLTSVSGIGLTSISNYAFYNCDYLTSVTMPNVKSIGHTAFYNSGLISVTIPDGVKTIGTEAFAYCESLTGILVIPDSVESIGNNAFMSTSLTGLSIGSGLTSLGSEAFYSSSVFYNCAGNLTSIVVADENTIYRSEDNCLIRISDDVLILGCTTGVIPDGVKKIGSGAFAYATMESLTIPASVTFIDSRAFNNCRSLKGSLTIPDGVTEIGNMAFSYTGLTSVTIPGTVTRLGQGAFLDCTKLISVTFGAGTALIIITAPGGDYSIGFNLEVFPEGSIPGGNTLRNAYNAATTKAGTYTRSENGPSWSKIS